MKEHTTNGDKTAATASTFWSFTVFFALLLQPSAAIQLCWLYMIPRLMGQVIFLSASEEINKQPGEYWTLVMDVARKNNLKRIIRCSQIMGRAETDDLSAAQIFYPCMQCADIFFLKVQSLPSTVLDPWQTAISKFWLVTPLFCTRCNPSMTGRYLGCPLFPVRHILSPRFLLSTLCLIVCSHQPN